MKRLANRVVLVTGSARGLGLAIARRCAEEGASLILSDVLEAEGRQAEAELASLGVPVRFFQCDITRAEQRDQLVAHIQGEWGRLDGLVNNAALATKLAGRAYWDLDEESWDRVFNVNVKGTWQMTKAVTPLLRQGAQARIVNMASDTALWGGDLFLHYIASKGAIISMTRGMARELGPYNIPVNAVAPGLTETEATASAPDRRWKQYQDGQLLNRRAQPTDIAGVVTMLLTDDGGFMSGQVLTVNGGMTFN